MKNSLREYMKIALMGNNEERALLVDDEEGWRQTISPQCRRDSAETGGNALKLSEP